MSRPTKVWPRSMILGFEMLVVVSVLVAMLRTNRLFTEGTWIFLVSIAAICLCAIAGGAAFVSYYRQRGG